MAKEGNAFDAVAEKLEYLTTQAIGLANKEKNYFLDNLKILGTINLELVKLHTNGLHQFSKIVATLLYLMLTNPDLLDKIVENIYTIIRDSGDYITEKTKIH